MQIGQYRLPDKVKVKVFKGESGAYIAELPDYDVSTEADSLEEIDFLVNDLIFAYFSVPKELRFKSIYF